MDTLPGDELAVIITYLVVLQIISENIRNTNQIQKIARVKQANIFET